MRPMALVTAASAMAIAVVGCTVIGSGTGAEGRTSAADVAPVAAPSPRANAGPSLRTSTKAEAAIRGHRRAAVRGHRPTLYVLGDSWSAGLFADPDHTLAQVAAARLHWTPEVDAASGTGYLNGRDDGRAYPQRAAAASGVVPDVIVVQGGSNDIDEPFEQLPGSVDATVHALEHRFPGARVVLLGPGPDPWPTAATVRAVDRVLETEAEQLHVQHVSMLDEDWITAANVNSVLDPNNAHPTEAGQRYLGERLAADLEALHLVPSD